MAVASESGNAPEKKSNAEPVVVDMGRKPRKQIRQLREGRGKLYGEVSNVLAELRTAGEISALAQPVVIVVRQRPRDRNVFWPLL